MAHRKWKETKQEPSLLPGPAVPGPAVPGCSLVSFHFLWAILCPQAVVEHFEIDSKKLSGMFYIINVETFKYTLQGLDEILNK